MTSTPGLFSLEGAAALVTGAGSGLGRAIAGAYAEVGAAVMCADRDAAGARRTAETIRACGGTALWADCDVTDPDMVAATVERAVAELGGLDVLVNNAGIPDPGRVRTHELELASWHEVLDVNLHGVLHCTRAALPAMLARGRGTVVNVASMWGLVGVGLFPLPAYAASKGAVVNLTRELALEYAADGIRVNALCPGFVRTNLGPSDDAEYVRTRTAHVPMGRIGDVADMRGPAVFLASPASEYMTGQVLVVDGGYTAR